MGTVKSHLCHVDSVCFVSLMVCYVCLSYRLFTNMLLTPNHFFLYFMVIRYDCPVTSNLVTYRQCLGLRRTWILKSGDQHLNPNSVTHYDSYQHLACFFFCNCD